jgi:hypothetical protein
MIWYSGLDFCSHVQFWFVLSAYEEKVAQVEAKAAVGEEYDSNMERLT